MPVSTDIQTPWTEASTFPDHGAMGRAKTHSRIEKDNHSCTERAPVDEHATPSPERRVEQGFSHRYGDRDPESARRME